MSSGVALPTAVPALASGALLTTANLYYQNIQPECPTDAPAIPVISFTCVPASGLAP